MKINTLKYKVYGKLIDHEIHLSPGITIFLGENEAGKSTIFNSIATLIYGFKPSSRDKHPYVNWTRNEINFSSEIIESGELFTVERSLKSMPRFNLSRMSHQKTQLYRNEPLPFVSHVSEALFGAVFHLTSDDLNQFEKASFESIQEKLIFNYGTDYLAKASDVIFQLEQDINALWRKDKRGNPKINQLQNEISQLKIMRYEAEKNHAEARECLLKIEAIDAALARAIAEKENLDHAIGLVRKNLPIRELIERIDGLKRSIYKMEAFIALDPNLIDKIEQRKIKIIEVDASLEKKRRERDQLKADLFVYSEHDKKTLEFKGEAESLKCALSDLVRLEHEEHSKLDEHMKLSERISAQFKILFDSPIDEAVKLKLKKLQVLDLMTLIQKYVDGVEKNIENERRSHNHLNKVSLISAFIGIAIAIAGFVYEPLRWLAFVGVGLIGFSAARFKKQGVSDAVDLSELKAKIEAVCHGFQLPEYVYRDNSLRFFGKLEQLILLLHEEDAIHDKWTSLIERQKSIEEMLSTRMQDNGFDTSRGVVLSFQYVLAQLDRLTEIEANEVKKRVDISVLEASVERERQERIDIEANLNTLIAQVDAFGEGDYNFGLKMIAQNTEVIRKIKVYSDELTLIEYDTDSVMTASEALLQNQEAAVAERIALEKKLITEKMDLSSELRRYEESTDLETINSHILIAEATRDELIEKRNQLMVLLEIVKFSDERFRVENQPNIITKVSRFMNQMTHGKYQEVLISEENGQFGLQFLIDGEIIPASKAFSKGTIQQLFFAYRLAVLEALDPQNLLPFVLDEVFVNWDSKRLKETLKLLDRVSEARQVIIFTCHRNLAHLMAEDTTSKLIEVAV